MHRKRLILLVSATAAAAVSVLSLAACGGSSSAAPASSTSAGAASATTQAVDINYAIKPGSKVGPDGKKHDAYWGPTSFTAHVGQRVTVTVLNYDSGMHSFNDPGLGVSQVFTGANGNTPSKTVFSFTPTAAGVYHWNCAIPCDTDNATWAMLPSGKGQDGFMAGDVTVTA